MLVRLLGPVEVVVDGVPRTPAGKRERALVALLALSAGEPVAAETVAAALWGALVPPDRDGALTALVERVRAESTGPALEAGPEGLRLHVGAGDVDALEFDRLIARADDEEPEVALATLQGATTAGSSLVVNNPGPGAHTFAVSAVNVGEGPRASATITLAKLSKPRKVADVRGAAGGKRTAGATWKPPAAAGGLAITGYKIAVFKKNGTKVDTKVVTASKLKYLFKLKKSRYYFKVRARNSARWGPWSKPTDLVSPR